MDEQKWLSDSYSSLKERYVALRQAAPGAVKHQIQIANLMERLSVQDEEMLELKKRIKEKNVLISALRNTKVKEIPQIEGAVVLIVDNKILGNYVSQKKYMDRIVQIEELEKELRLINNQDGTNR